jgi:hypothetical protein
MPDIVERLRKLAKLNAIGEGAAIVHKRGITEAAAEIERLRDAKRCWSAVADERAIEVAALRAALGAITLAETIDHAREIARAALADCAPGGCASPDDDSHTVAAAPPIDPELFEGLKTFKDVPIPDSSPIGEHG